MPYQVHVMGRRAAAACSAVACAALTLMAACRSAPTPADLLIEGVTVVDVRTGGLQPNHTLALRDGVIVSVAATGRVRFAATAPRIDARGLYAVPGLWDAHTHVVQEDVAQSIQQLVPLLLAQGITHTRDMSSSLEARRAFLAWARSDSAHAPEVMAPGPALWAQRLPYGDSRRQLVATTPAEWAAALDSLVRDSVDFVKVYSGFSAAALGQLGDMARARGLRLDGHVQDGVTLEQHAQAGFRTIEHVDLSTFGDCGVDPVPYFERVIAARFYSRTETVAGVYVAFGAALDRERCTRVLARARDLGLVLTPTLVATFATPEDVATLDTAAFPAAARADCARFLQDFARTSPAERAAFQAVGLGLTRLARDAGLPLLVGTDGPVFCSVPGANYALELRLLARAGLTPLEVLQAATLRPAQVLAPGRRLGVLEEGYEAHVTLLTANPLDRVDAYAQPAGVYTRRRWLGREALDSLRRSAQAFDQRAREP